MPCRQDNDPVGEWNSQSIYTVSMYKYIHWRTKDWNNLQILLLWKEIGTFIHQSVIQLITMYCQEINNVKHYYYNLNFFLNYFKEFTSKNPPRAAMTALQILGILAVSLSR